MTLTCTECYDIAMTMLNTLLQWLDVNGGGTKNKSHNPLSRNWCSKPGLSWTRPKDQANRAKIKKGNNNKLICLSHKHTPQPVLTYCPTELKGSFFKKATKLEREIGTKTRLLHRNKDLDLDLCQASAV